MVVLIFVTAVMSVAAETKSVVYIDYIDGAQKTAICENYTELTKNEQYSMGEENSTIWYVAKKDVTFGSEDDTVICEIRGDVRIIIENGATLTVNGCIAVEEGCSLTIYSCSGEKSEMGNLVVQNCDDYASGIGYYNNNICGRIVINGGNIDVSGGTPEEYGIGGYGAEIIVNGGNVNIKSDYKTSRGTYGIYAGGGLVVNSGNITALYDGNEKLNNGCGIYAYDFDMTGGNIRSFGGGGIGMELYGNINISGGKILAEADDAEDSSYGIYYYGRDANIVDNYYENGIMNVAGGEIETYSGKANESYGFYIYKGNLEMSEGSIYCVGANLEEEQEISAGFNLEYGKINITGGKLTGIGGSFGIESYGIYGYCDDAIEISGGEVIADIGDNIYYGIAIYSRSDMNISGGKIIASGKSIGEYVETYGISTRGRMSVADAMLTIDANTDVFESKGGIDIHYSKGYYWKNNRANELTASENIEYVCAEDTYLHMRNDLMIDNTAKIEIGQKNVLIDIPEDEIGAMLVVAEYDDNLIVTINRIPIYSDGDISLEYEGIDINESHAKFMLCDSINNFRPLCISKENFYE